MLNGASGKSSYKMGDGEEDIVRERLIFAKACNPVISVEIEREREMRDGKLRERIVR